jgi:hypothetical protein
MGVCGVAEQRDAPFAPRSVQGLAVVEVVAPDLALLGFRDKLRHRLVPAAEELHQGGLGSG